MKTPPILAESLENAFPDVDPGVKPLGQGVLVQIKNNAVRTNAGLILDQSSAQTEFDNTQVAKVIALGPVAYCNRETLKVWPEGHWCKVGDYVRIPLHTQAQRSWSLPVPGKDFRTTFTIIDDLQVVGIQADPFYIRAFL